MSNAIHLSAEDNRYLQIMEDLNTPVGDGKLVGFQQRLHDAQIDALKPLYQQGVKLLFLPCGRKFGKSIAAGYVLWRHALLNPGTICYYIAPENAQARKIMWDTQNLQKFMGSNTSKYIKAINNTEMKITLLNDSIIQCMGSDNWAAANGLTPSIAVYDEFKVFNKKFHTEFDPNRAAKAAPLVIIGTMPKVGDSNKEQYESLLDYASKTPGCAVKIYTTWDNPINNLPDRKAAIEAQINILKMRGEYDVIQREYYSRIVPGGVRSIFPMFDPIHHVKPHNAIISNIYRDNKKLEWFIMADPGTTTCFATLYGCVNPYTKKVYILDEIYEKEQKNTSTRNILPRIHSMCKELYPGSDIYDDWYKGYDEAAAWFANEVLDNYGLTFSPTNKTLNKKESGISLIKDLLITDFIVISDRCKNLIKEIEEYAKDDNGEIPKRKGINDHLIDCLRYFLGAANYTMVEGIEELLKKSVAEEFRDEIRKGLPEIKEDDYAEWDKGFDWL